MQQLEPAMITSALVEHDTTIGSPSPWLAGLSLDDFGGPEVSADVKIARAAASVGADILSPADGKAGNAVDSATPQPWVPFTTKPMIDEAHRYGMLVKPWTVNNLSVLEQHVEWGVDGVITDCKPLLFLCSMLYIEATLQILTIFANGPRLAV
jgi:glycerophosphoryl diester phosphodiesterase